MIFKYYYTMSNYHLSKMKRTLLDRIPRTLDEVDAAKYIPSGIQDEIIQAFGSGEYQIVYVSGCNKVGKTCVGANIIRNIAWPCDKEYFDYSLYSRWPFMKAGRIIGTSKNVSDDGPIRRELKKWLPRGKYEESKNGKPYYSSYDADRGMYWDVMTYDQDTDKFEGPMLGWVWADEPIPARLMGAVMSRFSKGGVLLVTATPIGDNVGAFLDVLEDLEARGTKIKRISCDIRDNSTVDGRMNSKGTKRGLMTPGEIQAYEATIPRDERDARLYGKPNHKAGKIYAEFDRSVHVIPAPDLNSPECRGWNCYLSMDPHRKYYPAVTCWAVTPREDYICFAEWPTVGLLDAFYHEIRESLVCPYNTEQLALFLKSVDGSRYGLHVLGHIVDPFFAAGTQGEGGRPEDSIVDDFAQFGINFSLPRREKKAAQRDRIRGMLSFDRQRPMDWSNRPRIYVSEKCQNMIQSFERHYWNGDDEAEEYKDFSDTARNFLSYIEGKTYNDEKEATWAPKSNAGVVSFDDIFGAVFEGTMKETGML